MRHLEGASSSPGLREDDAKHGGLLHEAVRDCGWCIYFQHGDIGLEKLAEAVLARTEKSDKYEIKHVVEHAFSGIGNWLAHGEY